MQEVRCGQCQKLLAKANGNIEVKCPRCGCLNHWRASAADCSGPSPTTPERPRASSTNEDRDDASKKPESKVEIINDINSDLTNLYRCVKYHLAELVAQFRWMLVSRDEFDRFLKTPADTLTDIQRAARFFYLVKTSFGARIVKPSYGISATGAPRLNLLRIEEDLSEAHLRLSRVFIECKPYDQVIKRFDKPGTLFYLDPPYWACEKDCGEGVFSREDFGRLAGLLDGLKGKFILSLNRQARGERNVC